MYHHNKDSSHSLENKTLIEFTPRTYLVACKLVLLRSSVTSEPEGTEIITVHPSPLGILLNSLRQLFSHFFFLFH